jgi:hypothetical protein
MFAPIGLLFGHGKSHNTSNQYQPLICSEDLCVEGQLELVLSEKQLCLLTDDKDIC